MILTKSKKPVDLTTVAAGFSLFYAALAVSNFFLALKATSLSIWPEGYTYLSCGMAGLCLVAMGLYVGLVGGSLTGKLDRISQRGKPIIGLLLVGTLGVFVDLFLIGFWSAKHLPVVGSFVGLTALIFFVMSFGRQFQRLL